jgi:hypothetical protein
MLAICSRRNITGEDDRPLVERDLGGDHADEVGLGRGVYDDSSH